MKYQVCDLHAHVVHGVDDGAINLNMAIEMLKTAHEQGTQSVVCSSHSGADVKEYFESLECLKSELKKNNINISLYSGCEVYCDIMYMNEIIDKLNKNKILTINNTRYVLAEFNPYETVENIFECVRLLQANGYKVIIAHIERCLNLAKDIGAVLELQQVGCLFQVNVYSIYDETNNAIKSFAQRMLEEKRITFIGSDAHRTNHRPYAISNGIDYIYKKCDKEYADSICYKNAKYILDII